LIKAFIPAPNKVGQPCEWWLRELWSAIPSISAEGYQIAVLLRDLPPLKTVQDQHHFYRLRRRGMFDIITEIQKMPARNLADRGVEMPAELIDRVKTKGSCDAGKLSMGREHYTPSVTQGSRLGANTQTADFWVRGELSDVIADTKESFHTVAHLLAAGGYAKDEQESAKPSMEKPTIEIVKPRSGATSFITTACRLVVERTFAGLSCYGRLAKDWDVAFATSDAWRLIASIRRTAGLIVRE